MSQLTVNDKNHFSIEQNEEGVFINSEEFIFDLKEINEHTFHILHENKSYTAELISLNKEEKKVKVKINGNEYEVSLYDKYDKLLESMGMNIASQRSEMSLKAPMPGLVLDIMVKEGDDIRKGDNLLVLEAMKMENMIKSMTDVTIKSIEVQKGSKVEKNQTLLTFE